MQKLLLILMGLIAFSCTNSSSNISKERENYLEQNYIGYDSADFSNSTAYLRHLDLLDKWYVSIATHSQTLACDPMDDDQFCNEIWKKTEPECEKFKRFITLQYISTVGFDTAMKKLLYPQIIDLRNKSKNNNRCY
jgi:hypothetical protein